MLAAVIDYLKNVPSASTSPLYLALNAGAMLTALNASMVTVYDTNATLLDPPYVRLFDDGTRQPLASFLGGAGRGYAEYQGLQLECVSGGATENEAATRAEYLQRAARSQIYKVLGSYVDGTLTATDKGGTSNYDKVIRWVDVSSQLTQPRPAGPGKNTSNAEWLCKRFLKFQVWVFKSQLAS